MLSDDLLPQPYRLVNKIVQEIVSNAIEEIGKRLLLGCVVDKSFVPPRTLASVPVELHTLSVVQGDSAAPTTVTATGEGLDTVFGLSTGVVLLVATDSNDPTLVTVPLVEGPVKAVASVRPPHSEPVIVVASTTTVVVVAVEPSESADENLPSCFASSPGTFAAAACRTLCTLEAEASLDSREISTVKLSLDGETLAVGVERNSYVYVFRLLPAEDLAARVVVPVLNASLSGVASQVSPDAAPAQGAPPAVSAPPGAAATFDFFCKTEAVGLGYYRETKAQHNLQAKSLFVAWVGASTISRFPLIELYSTAGQAIANARATLAAMAAAKEAAAAAAPAVAAGGGKGKAEKAGDPKGGAKAPVLSPTSADGATVFPLVPASFFSGRKDIVTQRTIVTVAFNETRTLAAVGCLDGLILLHDGTCVRSIYTAAPHRVTQTAVNQMYPVSLHFQPNSTRLVVGFVVQNISNRCFVDVYDTSVCASTSWGLTATDAERSSSIAGASEVSGDLASVGGAHRGASLLPVGCISRRKYLNHLRAVVPLGAFPFYIALVDHGAFLVDAYTGDVLKRVVGSAGCGLAAADLFDDLSPTTTMDAAIAHSATVAQRCAVTRAETALVCSVTEGSTRLCQVDVPSVIKTLYPSITPFIGHGSVLSQLAVDVINRYFSTVPDAHRNDRCSELTAMFSSATAVDLTLNTTQQKKQFGGTGGSSKSHDGRSRSNLSFAGTGGGGKRSVMASLTPGASAAASKAVSPNTLVAQGAPSSASKERISWESMIRTHIEFREDTKNLRQERLKGFWEAMRKR